MRKPHTPTARGEKSGEIGSGFVQPYGTNQTKTLSEEMLDEQEQQMAALEFKKDAFEKRRVNYERERARVDEVQQSLDDRVFRAISGATQIFLTSRFLTQREKHAYDLLTEPIDDLEDVEKSVVQLEGIVNSMEETLGPDRNDDEEAVNEQELNELNELNARNAERSNDITLRRSRVRQGNMIRANNNGVHEKSGEAFVAGNYKGDREPAGDTETIGKADRVEERLNAISKEMEEIDRLDAENKKTRSEQEREYGEKLKKIEDLLEETGDVEKWEFFVSEMQFEVDSLKADLGAAELEKEILEEDMQRKGEKKDEPPEVTMEMLEKRQQDLDERAAKVVERRKVLQEENAKLDEEFEKLKDQYPAIEKMYQEMAKKSAQAMSMEDLGIKMAEEVLGEKASISTSEVSLSKIEEIKRNLALMESDGDDDFAMGDENENESSV